MSRRNEGQVPMEFKGEHSSSVEAAIREWRVDWWSSCRVNTGFKIR